jgi:hypothetical protein
LDGKVGRPQYLLITAINERGFSVRIDALDCLETVSREWERPYASLRKKWVAYVLIVEMDIQLFNKLVGN